MSRMIKASYAFQQLLKVDMSEASAVKACGHIKVASKQTGKVIQNRGESFDNWYFIINGLLSAALKSHDESSTSLALLGSGTWFGEYSIINSKPCLWDYVALQDCDLLVLPGKVFTEILESDAGFSLYITKSLAWRSHHVGEMLILMKLGNPPLRVMMGISQFVAALAYKNERPPTIAFGEGVRIPLNQTMLSDLCGVSRSIFSGVIQHLVKKEIIRVSYGELEIYSIRPWMQFAAKKRKERFLNLNPTIDDLVKEFEMQL